MCHLQCTTATQIHAAQSLQADAIDAPVHCNKTAKNNWRSWVL